MSQTAQPGERRPPAPPPAAGEDGTVAPVRPDLSLLLESPQRRLARAALGRGPVQLRDVEAVLAGHLAEADAQASTLARHSRELIEFIFSNARNKKLDVEEAFKLVERVTRLASIHLGEARRTADLLTRISRPERPSLQVLAVGAGQVNVGEKVAAAGAVGLGGRSR